MPRVLKRIRRRRSPEVARAEILAAAQRVFADHQPQAVGLKDIAKAAGISHGLVTHYFGTYAGLIDAVLQQRVIELREATIARLRELGRDVDPTELLAQLFRTLEDPVHVRLARWTLAQERPDSAFLLRDQGMRMVVDQLIASHRPDASAAVRDAIEVGLLTAVSAAFGYALAKPALVAGLGRAPSPALDAAVLATLGGMLRAYLAAHLD
jgi:AcrR family transcriptional regulator